MMGKRLGSTIAVVLLIAAAAGAQQGSAPRSSEISAFLGTWVFTMTNPQGAQETVKIWDKGGTAAATVQAGRFPPLHAAGILYDGDVLLLTLTRFENGKPIRAVISLTRDGETMRMAQMLEFSETIKRGTGKKQEG
jgi:hypothetical protein